MTDVVEIAKKRRATLASEIGTLDDFIRMAAALVKYGQGLGRGPVMDADAGHFAFDSETFHFAFDEEALVNEDELVLTGPLSSDAAPAGVHVGQRMRQRRWMLGMTQRRLSKLVGVKFEQIRKYEAGASRISASTMRNIAAALEVSVSYFFEHLDGQAPDTGEALDDILIDR
jgi:DNA-binding XRE family transcriptional regulator